MLEEYSIHNLFRLDINRYFNDDPHLSILKQMRFVHPLNWWGEIDWNIPGIYLLTGGRQIGKTTSLKLLIKNVLEDHVFEPPEILYLPCDQIADYKNLGNIIRAFLETLQDARFLLVIDEVTYVKEWDRAIKALADEGRFRKGFCIITGSDSIILQEAMSRFPGRRGEAAKTDFHLRPLNFREYVGLVDPPILSVSAEDAKLLTLFENYLRCGGHLRAINDLHRHGEVRPATYAVFEQWVRGDFEKRGHSTRILEMVLKNIMETLSSQVTYSSLAHRTGEITTPTFLDYCHLLERMDIIFTLQAFDQNRHMGFPKKARKLHFWDPFILDVVRRWLERELLIQKGIDDVAQKAESVAAAHFKAMMPTYYCKGKGEIDVAALQDDGVVYAEVKWTKQIRPWDIAELKKHKNSVILARGPSGSMEGVSVRFLPRFLLNKE